MFRYFSKFNLTLRLIVCDLKGETLPYRYVRIRAQRFCSLSIQSILVSRLDTRTTTANEKNNNRQKKIFDGVR